MKDSSRLNYYCNLIIGEYELTFRNCDNCSVMRKIPVTGIANTTSSMPTFLIEENAISH